MASVEFINKRIEGKKAEIAKLEKKIERIEAAKATNWEKNPYYYSESDLKWANRDLEVAKRSLDDYEKELQSTIEKNASRDVKVILDFLDRWKNRMTQFFEGGLKEYYEELNAVKNEWKALNAKYGYYIPKEEKDVYDEHSKAFREKCRGKYEKREFTNRWGKLDHTDVKVEEGEYEYLNHYTSRCDNFNDAMKLLKKELDEDANAKYDFLIERVNEICGQITDASGLSVDAKGELNGIIKGTRGNASVKTIGAGGYNQDIIVNVKHGQRFHFRTLVRAV